MRPLRCPIILLLAAKVALAQGEAPPPLPSDGAPEIADPGFARCLNPAFPHPVIHAVPIDRGLKVERADVAPYFSEGKLGQAKAAFDMGGYKRAREYLDGAPDTPPVRFLRALAAYRAQDFASSASEFEKLADAYPTLRDRCLVHAGWSYEGLKDWDGAVRVFVQVSDQSRLMPDARTGHARALKNLKDVKGALAAVAPLVERPAPPWGRDLGAEALLTQADIYAFKGDKKAERSSLVALWARHPLSKEALRTEERLGALSELPQDAVVTHADALIDAHRNAQGLALLEPLLEALKPPDALACRAHFAAGKALRKLRAHARAAAVLGPVVKKCRDPDLRARALYTLGFSQTIAAPGLAAQTYEQLARDYPEHPYADDALFYAADVYLHRGEADPAVERLVELVDRYQDGDFAADALFRLYWVARKERPGEALEYLEEIEGRFRASEDTYEVERAQYWRARTYDELRQRDEAIALWSAVAKDHPSTYYGLISREHVEALDAQRGESLRTAIAPPTERSDPFPMYAGPLSADPQFQSAVELLRLGFGDLVPLEVLAIDRTRLPSESVRLLVHLLALSGEERAAHGLARIFLRRELTGPITKENRATWEVAYPLAFREPVTEHAAEADGLDPDLLQALMREESALDPAALSWAGALGLCQLMPATAAGVAMQLRLRPPSRAALLEPDLNIRLGSRYLADLVVRARGIKQYALAGYNAGEGSVARWKKDDPDAPLDVWVENIPLQETRGYVKRVLRSYNTYKLLYVPAEVPCTVGPVPRPAPKPKSVDSRGVSKSP